MRKTMNKKRNNGLNGRVMNFLLAAVVVITCLTGNGLEVKAAGTYDRNEALAFAEEYWNQRSDWLCAEYCSNVINKGGCEAWSRSCTALRTQLLNSGMVSEHELRLESDMSIKASNYRDVLSPGDLIMFYCGSCTDGRPYIHSVVYKGEDSNGYAKCYSHNNANSGATKYCYSKTCYGCGGRVTKAYSYHFSSGYNPKGVWDTMHITEVGTLWLTGWSVDLDDLASPVELHIYLYDEHGNQEAYGIHAREIRMDVHEAYNYGTQHGFITEIDTKLIGKLKVDVWAINTLGGGENVLLGSKSIVMPEKETGKISVTNDNVHLNMTTKTNETIWLEWNYPSAYQIWPSYLGNNAVNVEYGAVTTSKLEIKYSVNQPGITTARYTIKDSSQNTLGEVTVTITVEDDRITEPPTSEPETPKVEEPELPQVEEPTQDNPQEELTPEPPTDDSEPTTTPDEPQDDEKGEEVEPISGKILSYFKRLYEWMKRKGVDAGEWLKEMLAEEGYSDAQINDALDSLSIK